MLFHETFIRKCKKCIKEKGPKKFIWKDFYKYCYELLLTKFDFAKMIIKNVKTVTKTKGLMFISEHEWENICKSQ